MNCYKNQPWSLTFRLLLLCSPYFLLNSSCSPKEKLYVAHDFAFVGEFTQGLEGPAVDRDGNLFFVNPHHNGSIGKLDSLGNFSIFIENLPEGSTANGIRINSKVKLLLADYTGHKLLEVDRLTKEVLVYAQDSLLNQPNDIAICCNDLVFASDPNWKEGTGNLWSVEKGAFILLEANMGTTNGIEVSPDAKNLYVNESAQRNVWVYDLSEEGTLSNKRKLISFDDFGLDGMRCDVLGNLYITRYGKGTVVKVSPQGKILEEVILKGKKPSNIAFGGTDGRSVFVTLQDRGYIETFRVSHPGRAFVEQKKPK